MSPDEEVLVEVCFVGVGFIFSIEVAVTCVCIAVEDEAQLERRSNVQMSAKENQERYTCLVLLGRPGLVSCCKLIIYFLARCVSSSHPAGDITGNDFHLCIVKKGKVANSVLVFRHGYMYHMGYCCVNRKIGHSDIHP